MKVHISSTCPECHGQAYLPIGEDEDSNENKYIHHIPCSICDGSGLAPQWVTLQEFLTLLQQAQCPHHTSLHGNVRFTACDVWDEIEEVCDDCGSNMVKQTFGEHFDDPK